MVPIHFQGLNCYHDCVISIANDFGVNYPRAFSTLWSETDFRYDPYREAYLTKRLIANLELLGAKAENLGFPLENSAEKCLSMVEEGAFIIVGMDAFYIPWSQFYHTFYGPHYFIARNSYAETLFCVDPTYGKNSERIARRDITEHTIDMIRVSKTGGNSLLTEPVNEAREIVRTHPNTRQKTLSRMYACANGEPEKIILLAKYIDALICNRHLYRFFLEKQTPDYDGNLLLFNGDYFAEWNAVKNGLYKAAVLKNNESVIQDVRNHFERLIDAEIGIAESIITNQCA